MFCHQQSKFGNDVFLFSCNFDPNQIPAQRRKRFTKVSRGKTNQIDLRRRITHLSTLFQYPLIVTIFFCSNQYYPFPKARILVWIVHEQTYSFPGRSHDGCHDSCVTLGFNGMLYSHKLCYRAGELNPKAVA